MNDPSSNPQELLRVLAEENARHRANQRRLNIGILAVSVLVAAAMVYNAIRKQNPEDLMMFGGMVALFGSGIAFSSGHKAALKDVARLGTREAAGYLLEAYIQAQEPSVIEVCRAGLPLALTAVESADDFDDYQRGLLLKLLKLNYPVAVVTAAVECLGRVAGQEAISELERFHAAATADKRPGWQRLGHRALQILPDVRIRVARRIIESRTESAELHLRENLDRIAPDGVPGQSQTQMHR